MLICNKSVPLSVKKILNDFFENQHRFPRNDWNSELLLKIFELAFEHRHDIIASFELWKQLRCLKGNRETKLKIYTLATKIFFGKSHDHYVDNLFSGRLNFELITNNQHLVGQILLHLDHLPRDEIDKLFVLINKIPTTIKQKVIESLCGFPTARIKPLLERLVAVNKRELFQVFSLLQPNQIKREDFEYLIRHPVDELIELLITAFPLMKYEKQPADQLEMIAALSYCSPIHRKRIVKDSCSLLGIVEKNKSIVIAKMADLRKGLTETTKECLLQAFKPGADGNDVGNLILALDRFPQDHQKEAIRLLNESGIQLGRAGFLDTLCDIPLDARRPLCELVKKNCEIQCKSGGLSTLLLALKNIPIQDLQDLFDQLFLHFPSLPKHKLTLIATLVSKINTTIREERPRYLEFCVEIFPKLKTFDSVSFLLDAYYTLRNQDERAESIFIRLYRLEKSIPQLILALKAMLLCEYDKRYSLIESIESAKKGKSTIPLSVLLDLYACANPTEAEDILSFYFRYLKGIGSIKSLNFLLKIPAQDRVRVMEAFAPLTKQMKYGEDVQRMLELVAIHYEDAADLCSLTSQVLGTTRNLDGDAIFKSLIPISCKKRKTLIESLLPILPLSMTSAECAHLIEQVYIYPETHRKELLEILNVVLEENCEVNEVLKCIKGVPLEFINQRLNLAVRLNKHYDCAISNFFIKLCPIPTHQLAAFVNTVEGIFRRFPLIKDIEGLFSFAANNHDEQFDKILQKIESFKFKVSLSSELVGLFNYLDTIPSALIHNIINATDALLEGFDILEQGKIISLFRHYREEQWPQLLADIKFLTENCYIKRSRFEMIETYLAPSTSKMEIRKYLNPFLEGYRGNRLELVKNLLSFSRRFWVDIYPLCLPLLAKCPNNPHLKVKIMMQVSQVYPKQRENIVHHIAALDLSPDHYYTLFQLLQNVPRIKRDQLLKDGEVFLKSVRDSHVASLIGHLDALPPEKRKDLIKEFPIHFTNAQDSEIGQILMRLNDIPTQKRHALYAFLEPYFSICKAPSGRIAVMSALSEIPENQWNAALHIYTQLMNVVDSWDNILPFVLQLPGPKQTLCLQIAQRFFHIGQLEEDQLRLLKELLKDGSGNRFKRLAELDKSISYLSIRQRILALEIIDTSPETTTKFILQSDFWKKRYHFPNKLMEIFSSLAFFTPAQINDILEIVFPILPMVYSKKEEFFLCLLEHYRKLPKSQWAFFTHSMLTVAREQRLESHHLLYAGVALSRLGIPFLEKTLPHVRNLLERIASLKERVDFLNELREAKLDHLPHACALMQEHFPFMKEHQGTLVKILTLIPAESRAIIFSQALRMTHYADDQATLQSILKILKQLNMQERSELTQFVDLINSRMSYLHSPDLILKELSVIRSANREKVVRFYLNFPFHPDIRGHKLFKMIDRVISQGDEEKLQQLAPILQLIGDELGLINSIPILLQMLAEDRKDLLSRSKTAAKEFHDPSPFIRIIYMLKNDDFCEILKTASPLLKNIDNVNYIEDVLTQLSLIPNDDRSYMIDLVLPLQTKMRDIGTSGEALKQILADLYSLPRCEHAEILDLVNMFGKSRIDYTGNLIHSLVCVEQSERREIVEAALSFKPDLPASSTMELVRAISRYSRKERLIGLHQLLYPLFSQVDNPHSQLNLLTGLSWFREKERGELIELLPPFVRAHGEGNEHLVLQNVLLIAPQHRIQVVELLHTESLKFGSHLLSDLFHQYADIRKDSHEYLNQLLDEYLEDRSLSFVLVNALLNFANSLLLHEEHPVLQKAIEIMALHSTDNDRLNPYHLFRWLKRIVPREEFCSFQPPDVSIGPNRIAIPLQKWRANARPKIYRLSDLPKDLISFEQLFKNFERRLSQLTPNIQAEIHHYVSECYQNVPCKLQEDFLDKQYVRSLFQISGPPDLIIEPAAYFIHVILQFICGQDDHIREGKLITDREEALFRVSCSINECKTGQRDGIISFYNYLPEEYSAGSKRESEDKIGAIIRKSIQGVLQQTFSNIEFVKLLDPSATSSQYPHKAMYLMNRLHRQVGYDHRLTFDANTGLVPEAFLDIPLLNMLKHFFTICTPDKVINRFRREIEEALRVKSICYMDLAYVLEVLQIKIAEGIIVNEFDMPIGVTEEAALAILIDCQALEELKETKRSTR